MDVTQFNWADYSIIAIIVLSGLVSLIRGFVREALSLATWILAVWVSITFATELAELFAQHIQNSTVRYVVSFGLLFLMTLILGAMLNFLISQLVQKTGLSGTDRVLGVVFGIARGILLIALLLLLAVLTPLPQQDWWNHSILIPQFHGLEQWLKGFFPEYLSPDITKAG